MQKIRATIKTKVIDPWRSQPKFYGISKDLCLAILLAVTTICLGVFLGAENDKIVLLTPAKEGFRYLLEPHNPLSFMANWDAVDYLAIVKAGYKGLYSVNWFPLFPMLVYAVNHIVPSPLDSALLIAWLSLIGAIYYYLKVVRQLFHIEEDIDTVKATMLFVLFPTGIFLIAPFTESLYAMLSLGAIYYALRKRYIPCALLALLCTATHVTGPLVLVLIGLILLEQKAKLRWVVATLAVGSLGLLSYMAFLYLRFGDPLAFVKSQDLYHGWQHSGYAGLIGSAGITGLAFTALLLIAAVYWWRHGRRSFAVYCLSFLAIPVLGHQFGGFDRYILMAFPVPLMFYAYLRNKPNLYTVVIVLSSMFWTFFMLQYAAGYIGS